MTYPFVFQMAHVGRVDNGDGQFAVWNVAWVARALVLNPLHVFDANIFYPNRWTLAYSESNIGAGLLAIPAYWLSGNPFLAHNLVFVLSFVLSACGAYYLVRYLTTDRYAASVAGICFAFCPYVFARTAEIQLTMTAGLPFSLLALHRLADRPQRGRAVVLGAAMAGQAVCCGYYGVFVTLMIGFAVLAIAAQRGLWRHHRYWTTIGAAAGVAMLLAAPVFAPYAFLRATTGFVRPLEESVRWSANWRAYLASSSLGHAWMLRFVPGFNEVLFPGFVATACGIAGVIVGWRRGGSDRQVVVLYGALGALALWASFGQAAGLYAALYAVIPLFSWLHAPARFGILVTLALSVLTGLTVAALRRRRGNSVAVIVAVVAAGELFIPLRFAAVPPVSAAYTVLQRLPPAPVVEFPFWSRRGEVSLHSQYMLNSTAHWMPLVNGYSDFMPPDFVRAAPILAGFPSVEAFDLLEPLGAKYAVVHLDLFPPRARPGVLERLTTFESRLRPLSVDGDTRLYEIVASR